MSGLTTLAHIGFMALLTALLLACSGESPSPSPAPEPSPPSSPLLPPQPPSPQPASPATQMPAADKPAPTSPSPFVDDPFGQPAPHRPQVAIIIDDIGYHLQHGIEAARLPGALTLAVLPHSPNGVALAELGHEQGKEIILHNPMSTIAPRQLDPGGLTGTMAQPEFEAVLRANLASIPHVSGLNNHMGSRLTQQAEPMQWLMHSLARENLFFIDSRTSANSVALEIARQTSLPSRKRDVFLDNDRSQEAIARQFEQLIDIARQQGSAIGIGHPYPETLAFLLQAMPRVSERGIELVPVSRLLPTYTVQRHETRSATQTLEKEI